MKKYKSFSTETRISTDVEGKDNLVSTRVSIRSRSAIKISPETEKSDGWFCVEEWEAIKRFIDTNLDAMK